MPRLFEGAAKEKKNVALSVTLGIVFFLIEYAYQFLIIGDASLSIVRSAAFTAATLIGLALIAGPLARIFPKRNYIAHRRTLGVLGFTFCIVHAFAVIYFILGLNLGFLFFSLDVFANPVLFGLAAFIIYIPLYVTSTDWANTKLGFRKWKTIHRLVYIAWILTVMHFVIVNTPALYNLSGYLLLAITLLVFSFETAAFLTWPSRGKNTIIGLVIITAGAVLFYGAAYASPLAEPVIFNGVILYAAFTAALAFIKKKS